MMMKSKIWRTIFPLVILTGMAVMFGPALPRLGAAQQDQQTQDQQKQQDQQKDDQTDQQPKKKGGMFGGLKKVTSGKSDNETASTASGGAKGALDGKQIADKTPTAADKQQVTDMEKYSVPQNVLKKFQDDGHLQPK
ncbi:MAG TPA: hypothetical protein VKV95_03320 [Terriglobia bacterium]|nr:hypothetical protein [Terriglobia bacterium]